MKVYRRIEDILVFQWKGDFLIVDEINSAVKSFNESLDNKIKIHASFDADECLIISNCHDYGTLSLIVENNNYVIFDITDKQTPLNSYSEKEFSNKFILI